MLFYNLCKNAIIINYKQLFCEFTFFHKKTPTNFDKKGKSHPNFNKV